ncbi:MAG TPA: serine/threonine protein phosphatase [Chloroflexi bacterium]|nr:serine/threonine protein phosphatase [Chloroflexota bacterium]HBY08926.1 serine/threonine protein phosphatase [Chloroflexota bacterium]
MNRRTFLKLTAASLTGIAALATGGWMYATKIEPGWLQVSSLSLMLPRLHPAFDSYRIVQISDIHLETWINRERLAEVIKTVQLLRADLIVITGDFVTDIFDNTPTDLIDNLSQLSAKDGILAVMGNHDYWTNEKVIRQVLKASNIRELSNEVLTLERGQAQLHLAGVDDYWENKARLREVLAQLPPAGAAILLAHEPDFAVVSAESGRFDLQLSGHTHGGQVNLPRIGPLVLPMYGRRYPAGLYQIGQMQLYTNRGLGTARPQIRFNCRPEIAMITLHAPLT